MKRLSHLAPLGAASLLAIATLAVAGTPEPSTGPGAAIAGRVQSAREGAMEGVVVSARLSGSPVTISVVTDAGGNFAFPDNRLRPGRYSLAMRAGGYDLAAPASARVVRGRTARADLRLVPAADPEAQLSSGEWLLSAPGSDAAKRPLDSCGECHTLARPFRSTHGAEEWIDVMQRMGRYAFNAAPEHPQLLPGAMVAPRERYAGVAAYLAGVNLSGGRRSFPLRFLPRVTGRGTRVIVTEYDLPRKVITQPHDVVVDAQGFAWYCDFGQPYIGRLDPRTGAVREWKLPTVLPDAPVGSLGMEYGPDGALWISMLYQNAIARFDPRTERFRIYPAPPEQRIPGARLSHLNVDNLRVDNRIWTMSFAGPMRIDISTGATELVSPFNGSRPDIRIFHAGGGAPVARTQASQATGPDWLTYWNGQNERRFAPAAAPRSPKLSGVPGLYGLITDKENNLYALNFAGSDVYRINARDGFLTRYPTSAYASQARRGHIDPLGRIWVALYGDNSLAMIDPETDKLTQWRMPTPWTSPYDVAADRRGDAWTAGMNTDRVIRFDSRTGGVVEYPLPHTTNTRRVFIEERDGHTVFWVGNNHAASIIRVEPLD